MVIRSIVVFCLIALNSHATEANKKEFAAAAYFFSGASAFFSKSMFPFNGAEKWYAIFENEVRAIPGVVIEVGEMGDQVLYTDRKQLENVIGPVSIEASGYSLKMRYAFTGIKEIKVGPFDPAKMTEEKCIKQTTRRRTNVMEGLGKDQVCERFEADVDFKSKKYKFVRKYIKTDDGQTDHYSSWIVSDGKEVILGDYPGGGAWPIGDLNHDGKMDFVAAYGFHECGGNQIKLLMSENDKLKTVFEGENSCS